ncbi:hypothetical protein BY996DRAFT_6412752 [Phakopsora pachyrhizi]|nr:hypothetical protein BY996DRAFT_6412752 [Phakopsora pachyrhizi]
MDDSLSASFGHQLNDQLPRIQSIVHEQIEFVGDVRDYLKERAALERQYGASLQRILRLRTSFLPFFIYLKIYVCIKAIVKKAMDKQSRREQALSVGLEPSKQWSGATSTLDSAWSRILTEADEEASDHTNLADSLQNEVCEPLKSVEKRKEATCKKHLEYSNKLLSERDKLYNEKQKAKQRYDDACASVESSRVKQGQAKDEKHLEKASKTMDHNMNEMLSAKNSYLISISVANESLWTLTTLKLVSLMKITARLSGKYLQSLFAHNDHFLTATNSISPTNDQELFIDYNRRPFSEPQDFQFEPCPIWHDSEDFSLNATEPKILLQNRLGQARLKAKELEPTIDTKRKEVSKLENLTKAYSQNESLGDSDSVLENFLDTVEQTTTLELQYTVLAKEIEVLEAALGDDQGSQRPHNFKSASFVTPTSCYLCNSSIWGITKQGVTCKACSIHAHVKCGPKVPANCPGSAPMHSNHSHLSSAMATASPSPNSQQTFSESQKEQSLSSLKRAATKANNVPPRQANLNRAATSVNSNRAIRSTHDEPNIPKANVIYAYEATSVHEVTVAVSEIVKVIGKDDGSGWIKVEKSDRKQGLVPISYIEIIQEAVVATTPSPSGRVNSIPPRIKKAKVLYDYEARDTDEHSISVGEVIRLTKDGENYGEGWFEIFKDGRNGIVPSNYVELL